MKIIGCVPVHPATSINKGGWPARRGPGLYALRGG